MFRFQWLITVSILMASVAGCAAPSVPEMDRLETQPMRPDVQHPDDTNLRVLTWNTWLLPMFSKRLAQRRDVITTFLLDHRETYDIIALQEVWSRTDRKNLASTLAPNGHQVGYFSEYSNGGLMILYSQRFKLIAGPHQHTFKACSGEDGLKPKGALHVRLQVDGSENTLDVVVTHTQSNAAFFTSAGKWKAAQLAQMSELREFADTYCDPEVPLLMLGDFNIHRAPAIGTLAPCYSSRNDQYGQLAERLSVSDLYASLDLLDHGLDAQEVRQRWVTYDPTVGGASDCEAHYDYVFSANPDRPIKAKAGALIRPVDPESSLPLSDHTGVDLALSVW